MKSGNKLNKALKDALNEHPVPLHDAQWERIRLELEEKKRRPIWWFVLPGLLMLGLVGGLVWQMGIQPKPMTEVQKQEIASTPVQTESSNTSSNDKVPTVPPSNVQINSSPQTLNNEKEPVQANTSNERTQHDRASKNSIKKNGKKIEPKNHPYFNKVVKFKDDYEGMPNYEVVPKPKIHLDERIGMAKPEENIEVPVKIIEDKVAETNELPELSTDDSLKLLSVTNNKKDSIKKKNPNDDTVITPSTKFVFGFASGFSWVKTSVVGLTNQEYMHKDTRKVFEAGNDNQRSLYFNFSVEYKFGNLGLKVNSGLQYRSVQNDININYRVSELPWRNSDNTIAFYVKVPDSSARVISLKSRQSFNFITLPLQLSYGMPINKKWEMLFNAGVNVSALVGVSGFMVDLDANGISESHNMLKQQVTLGYTGGIQLSRQLYNRWWLGLECNIGTINLNYDLGYGTLKSRILTRNLNLQLRYKL